MIFLVTALKAEANPFIRHYKLQPQTPNRAFTVYANDGIKLVVSGVGKSPAAAATAYLYAATHEPANAAWINIGIAGHATLPIGELCIAHKITDCANGRRWYPPQILRHSFTSCELLCKDRPDFHYSDHALLDMEAAGFYETACRFSSGELIHVLKIISDNAAAPANSVENALKAADVETLISNRLTDIADYIGEVKQLSQQLESLELPASILQAFTSRWHFTVTQEHRLKNLLQRHTCLQPGKELRQEDFTALKNSRQVLQALQEHLDKQPVDFSGIIG